MPNRKPIPRYRGLPHAEDERSKTDPVDSDSLEGCLNMRDYSHLYALLCRYFFLLYHTISPVSPTIPSPAPFRFASQPGRYDSTGGWSTLPTAFSQDQATVYAVTLPTSATPSLGDVSSWVFVVGEFCANAISSEVTFPCRKPFYYIFIHFSNATQSECPSSGGLSTPCG